MMRQHVPPPACRVVGKGPRRESTPNVAILGCGAPAAIIIAPISPPPALVTHAARICSGFAASSHLQPSGQLTAPIEKPRSLTSKRPLRHMKVWF
jgi:hypothetical protein